MSACAAEEESVANEQVLQLREASQECAPVLKMISVCSHHDSTDTLRTVLVVLPICSDAFSNQIPLSVPALSLPFVP